MSDDIVARLRECRLIQLTTCGEGKDIPSPIHVEAADEIERLRAVLRDAERRLNWLRDTMIEDRDSYEGLLDYASDIEAVADNARAALEQKP